MHDLAYMRWVYKMLLGGAAFVWFLAAGFFWMAGMSPYLLAGIGLLVMLLVSILEASFIKLDARLRDIHTALGTLVRLAEHASRRQER